MKTYQTPQKIVRFIQDEIILKNPPYDVRKNTKRNFKQTPQKSSF